MPLLASPSADLHGFGHDVHVARCSCVGGLINAPQMGVPNLAQAAPIMDRAVPG